MKTTHWRYIHLSLALLISVFLIIASVTGGILAFDKILTTSSPPYSITQESVAEIISKVQPHLSEITEIEVINHQIQVKGFNEKMEEVQSVVNPQNGDLIPLAKKKSEWISTITTLHRSLFLHEFGRYIIGGVSVLFLLSLLSGGFLLYQRQGKKWWYTNLSNTEKIDFIHFIGGKWFSFPLLIIALTGSVMFIFRIGVIEVPDPYTVIVPKSNNTSIQEYKNFSIFKQTPIAEVKKLTFPLFEDDEEFFELSTSTDIIKINQFNGITISQQKISKISLWKDLNQAIHTGDIHPLWAFVLLISTIIILLLVGSGFFLWYRRKPQKIGNQYTAQQAEYIILVGSENGSTYEFAKKIHQQLLDQGKTCFLGTMNDYQLFSSAKYLLIFTSTYGNGEAPENACHFTTLLKRTPQTQDILYSTLGFGSKIYTHFCAFAKLTNDLLSQQSWAKENLSFHTVNEYSTEDICQWTMAWNEKNNPQFHTNPAYYHLGKETLNKFIVVAKSSLDTDNQFFTITLKPKTKITFQSGDILGIYPDGKERLYSIGKINDTIHLLVKLHPHGLGSGYLYQLNIGDNIEARVIENRYFHLPTSTTEIIMIANGTGLAPFIGMINTQQKNKIKHLYMGLRYQNSFTESLIQSTSNNCIQQLSTKAGYSRNANFKYVTDLLKEDTHIIIKILKNKGVIMICGSLAMQREVEQWLEDLCQTQGLHTVERYKKQYQILTDCY